MKNNIVLWFFLLQVLGGIAQQEPIYSQYRTNAFVLNPAVAGTRAEHEIRLNTRAQWRGLPGAPRTHTLSWNGPIDAKNGVGLIAFADATGPSVRTGVQAAYAFRIPLAQPGTIGQNYLSIGLAGKYMQYTFQSDRVYFESPGDITAYEALNGVEVADVAVGLYYYNDNLFAGVSSPNLIQSGFGPVANQPGTLINQLHRHYFGVMGYRFVYDEMILEPSVLIRKVQTTPYQIEGNVKFLFLDEKLMAGISYRTDWLITLMGGVEAGRYHIYYSMDLMTSSRTAGNVFGPTNEFTLGVDLGPNSGTPLVRGGGTSGKYYRQ
ncbi:MAG: type IX secretion system membrane protein PorP/SprF [Bacteroidia bacterium]|nr:type IX secretion system membrane protein PorP/SprF [Bacteroidia bacterium]